MPLYKKRLRQRSVNQSMELARTAANKFNIALDVKSVMRVRDTQSQTGLNKKQRRKNIRAAFEIVEPTNSLHEAIVDDVVTTASTIKELARIFFETGMGQTRGCMEYCQGHIKQV